jgi:NAD(P)-dependent dehydrogenase (short-subunit alcohol dehydrogenase family)
MSMKNETAIVTGSTSGIGKKIAELLLKEGCKVMICSRKEENVKKIISEFKERFGELVDGIPCDVGDINSVKSLVDTTIKKFGKIRILVANAGISLKYGPIQYMPVDEAASDAGKIIQVNLLGMINTVSAILPHMVEQQYGRIITLSGGGADRPLPNLVYYSASKGGVVAFSKCFAEELKESGLDIKINIFQPGMLKTGLTTGVDVVPGWRDVEDVTNDTELVLQYVGGDIEQTVKHVLPYAMPSCTANGKYFKGYSLFKLIGGFIKVDKIRKKMQKQEKQ